MLRSDSKRGSRYADQIQPYLGNGLIVSSVLWLAGVAVVYASGVAEQTRPWEGLPRTLWMIGANTLVVAGVLLAVGIAGLNRRHGGSLGAAGPAAFWIAIITAVTVGAAWAWGVWITAFAIGAAVLATALIRAGAAPQLPSRLVGVGGVFVAVAAWVIQSMSDEVSFGEGTFTVLIGGGLVVYSLGLAWLGVWLISEQPVEKPTEVTAI